MSINGKEGAVLLLQDSSEIFLKTSAAHASPTAAAAGA